MEVLGEVKDGMHIDGWNVWVDTEYNIYLNYSKKLLNSTKLKIR